MNRRSDGFAVATIFARFDDGAWSMAPQPPGTAEGLSALSCARAGLCVALGATDSYLYDGHAWTIGPELPGNASRTASCAAPDFCLEVQPTTLLYETIRDGKWSAPSRLLPVRGTNLLPEILSCSSPEFCMGISALGYYWTFDGRSWSAGARLPLSSSQGFIPAAVSCAGSRFCVAVSGGVLGPEAMVFNGTQWSPPSLVFHQSGFTYFASVSCPATGFCMAVGSVSDPGREFAVEYRDGHWLPETPLGRAGGQPAVSCAGVSFCLTIT